MQTFHPRSRRARRGSALVAVLGLTVTIAMLSAVLLQQSVAYLDRQSGSVDKKKALYLAETGLAEALHSLRSGGSGSIGTSETPAGFGDGALFVETTEDANGLFIVEATGIAGGARATLENVIEPVIESAAVLGATGFGSVKIGEGAVVRPICSDEEAMQLMIEQMGTDVLEAYLKATGQTAIDLMAESMKDPDWTLPDGFEIPDMPLQMSIGSNGSIQVTSSVTNPTKVLGDLAPGPDGTVELGPMAVVTGSTAPSRTKLEVPEIIDPDLPVEASFTLPASTTMTVGPDERCFSGVLVDRNATLRIVGPTTLSTRTLQIAAGATLEIDSSGGPVEIFTQGGFRFGAGAQLSSLQDDPRGVTFYVSAEGEMDFNRDGVMDPNVTLPTAGRFDAQIVAPHVTVEIPTGLVLRGNVVAHDLLVSSGSALLFDNSLLIGEEQDSNLSVISWQVHSTPTVVARDLTTNLVAKLRLQNGGVLPMPCDAEMPLDYGVVYENDKGEERIYRGTEADWIKKTAEPDSDIAAVKEVLDTADAQDREVLERERTMVGRVAK